ncbi:hypothetical protein PoB_002972600 [Plakobranchus ocellatus]|uniref:Uncharacterized protein n=1 Tax=Plakobranchus ocellatus TaxID=259542 RepID=A0AAV3ZW87_9GAST|nr:hypothetical protein PoB_002972600 [Plakobranchus ocellatus]
MRQAISRIVTVEIAVYRYSLERLKLFINELHWESFFKNASSPGKRSSPYSSSIINSSSASVKGRVYVVALALCLESGSPIHHQTMDD